MSFFRLSANRLVLLGFAGAILAGTALLKLPMATAGGISWLDALFEATSAVTVTGLQVVDPPRDFTVFGQVVLAVLIQAGGLGIITATTLGVVLIGGHPSYKELMAAEQEENLPGGPGNLGRLIGWIALFTLVIELVGTLFFTGRLISLGWDLPGALGHAAFNAISAFCNAGLTTFSGGISRFDGDVVVNLVFVALILLGGLGFPVLMSLYRYPKVRLTLHAKLVLATYAVLTPLGVLGFAALEWTNPQTLGGEPLRTKVLESLFQGVTPRTAGFSTVSYSDLSAPTLATQIPLMFVGAAPASTGGGGQGDGARARLPARRRAGSGWWGGYRVRTPHPGPLPPQDPRARLRGGAARILGGRGDHDLRRLGVPPGALSLHLGPRDGRAERALLG